MTFFAAILRFGDREGKEAVQGRRGAHTRCTSLFCVRAPYIRSRSVTSPPWGEQRGSGVVRNCSVKRRLRATRQASHRQMSLQHFGSFGGDSATLAQFFLPPPLRLPRIAPPPRLSGDLEMNKSCRFETALSGERRALRRRPLFSLQKRER